MSKSKRERSNAAREEAVPVKRAKITASSASRASKSSSKFDHKLRVAATKSKEDITASNSTRVFQETETDSDPIEESDTQSESGADDGVSWPSDNEAYGAAYNEDRDIEMEEEEDGGVKLTASSKVKDDGNTSVANGNGLSTSRESHQKQKALAQERKAAKPHADVFARSKKIWERLRLQSHVPLPERKKLVAELFELITGRVKDFVLKHDTSRIIQTALKYGNLEQRKMIARELKGTYCELAQSKFAKHAIGKILVHGDDEIRDMVIPEFYGSVRKLIKHSEAAWILDDVYRGAATPTQKAILLREWYGAEFAIFKPDTKEKPTAELSEILKASPEKNTPILRYLFELINQLIQKKTTGFTMLHDAMLQYYLNVRGTDVATEFLEVVKGDEEGDLLKNLAFTKAGARLVSLLLAYSSAKDRKQVLKAYKGVISAMAYDQHAHKVLLVALDVTDDTRLTGKSIYGELLPPPSDTDEAVAAAHSSILEAALHKGARTVILYPFANKLQSILPKETEQILSETQTIKLETSKKDSGVRKQELAKAIAPQLLAAIPTQLSTLIAESFGCQFVTEVLLACSAQVADFSTRDPSVEAMLACIQDPAMKETFLTPHAGRMLKSLVLSGHFSPTEKRIVALEPGLNFADRLFCIIKDDLVEWATGANSFTIVGLVETGDISIDNRRALSTILYRERHSLKEAAQAREKGKDGEKERGNKGAEILLAKLESGDLGGDHLT